MTQSASYSDEEAKAIFRRALERQQESKDGYQRDELMAAAREIGLDDGALEEAARELEAERAQGDVVQTVKKRQRERWLRHLLAFTVLVGGLLGMHALAIVGTWVFWLALVWATALAMHTFNVARGPSEEAVGRETRRRNRKARRSAKARAKRAENERRKLERRAEKRARHSRVEERSRSKRQRDDQLDRLIEDGVAMLLGAAANRIERAAQQADRRPNSDFGRYVARKEAERRGESVTRTQRAGRGPRVRVAPSHGSQDRDAENVVEAEVRRRRRQHR